MGCIVVSLLWVLLFRLMQKDAAGEHVLLGEAERNRAQRVNCAQKETGSREKDQGESTSRVRFWLAEAVAVASRRLLCISRRMARSAGKAPITTAVTSVSAARQATTRQSK